MKISKVFSGLFALVGAALAAFTVMLCLWGLDREPVLVEPPHMAVSRVEALFQAVCSDDYPAASALIYGQPDLGAERTDEDSVSSRIWDAFVDSMGYELSGECYATDHGVAQKVLVSYLDITSVTDGLQVRARELLLQRVREAEDVDQIYDENNDYRLDFVDAVVSDAMEEALREDARYQETELTVNLVYHQGQWWILADEALMQAISGGVIR
jgi:hypothetical protein